MRRLTFSLILMICSMVGNAGAVESDLSGSIETKLAYGFNLERPVLSRIDAILAAKMQNANCKAKLEIRLRLDRQLEPEEHREADLREFYLACHQDDWLFSLGRQFVIWGKTDGFRVLDAVHSFDYREFILDSDRSSRLPLAMLRIERRIDENNLLQVLVIPEHRKDVLPSPGGAYARVWPQIELISNSPETERSSFSLSNWGYAIKWERTAENVSFSLNALDRRSSQLTYEFTSEFNPLTGKFSQEVKSRDYRYRLLGASLDFPVSDFVLRVETIYAPLFYAPAVDKMGFLQFNPYRQFSYVVGVDKHLGEWFVSVQFFETHLNGGALPPFPSRTQRVATLLVTRSFLQDKTKLRIFFVRDLSNSGSWLSASVSHDITPNLELTLGSDFFSGSQDSAFGRISAQDRIFAALRYSF